MLDALGGPVANTDFQKLLFLHTKECETSLTNSVSMDVLCQ